MTSRNDFDPFGPSQFIGDAVTDRHDWLEWVVEYVDFDFVGMGWYCRLHLKDKENLCN